MSKHHDENKDLRLISRKVKVNYSNKTLQVSKETNLGIRTLGRIDYLCNHCGWTLYWDNSIVIYNNDLDNNIKRKREAKKEAKEKTLTNKKRKKHE